jgi:hypothetical protein
MLIAASNAALSPLPSNPTIKMSSTTLAEMEERYMTLFKKAQGGNPLRSPSVGATSTTAYLGDLEYAIDKQRYSLGLPLRFHSESMFSQQAFDPYELEEELAELETKCKAATAPALKANLQIQMDKKLVELGRATRYYMPWELEQITRSDNVWPTEPRELLSDRARLFSAPPAIRAPPKAVPEVIRPVPLLASPKPETVEVKGGTTLTLDALIYKLSVLRSRLGGTAPVWHVEFGGVTAIDTVEEWEGGVCIDG